MRAPPPPRRVAAARGLLAAAALLALALPAGAADAVRVKDLGKLQGWRDNALVGYGIVTGLAGTGDAPGNRTTRQALSNVFSRFDLTVPADQVQSRNVAVVMVSAALPAFAHVGETIDVTVTSAGDARSLVGGSLLLTPLTAPNGKVYALAQGPLSVGGYRYDANGNVVQKNHPTVGSIPNGATVEVAVDAQLLGPGNLISFVLSEPDYSTARAVTDAINGVVGAGHALARDASTIDIQVAAAERADLVTFVARLETLTVQPDRRAKVVIDERSGTVVVGGDVRIDRVAVSHGDLKVSIATENYASQPTNVIDTGRGVRTAIVTNTFVTVDEQKGADYVSPANNTVADLVQALSALKLGTRDIISILRAVKAAGALHAELVVQ
jgi:flagellar P-ring protein FlgI